MCVLTSIACMTFTLLSNHHSSHLTSALTASPAVPRKNNNLCAPSKHSLSVTSFQTWSHIPGCCQDSAHGCRAVYLDHSSCVRHLNIGTWTKPLSSIVIGQKRILSELWATTDSDCETDSSSSSTRTILEPEEIAKLPLSDILQILNERNVRYAPDATRAQLEKLLLQYVVVGGGASTTKQSTSRESGPLERKRERSNFDDVKSEREDKEDKDVSVSRLSDLDGGGDDVLDVIILRDDDPSFRETSSPIYDSNDYSHESYVNYGKVPRRENAGQFSPPMDAYYSSPGGRRSRRRRKRVTRRQYPNDNYDKDSYWDRRSYQQWRQNRYRGETKSRSRNDYDVYNDYYDTDKYYVNEGDGNIIDLETFHLSDNFNDDDNGRKPIYENGIQIFLMGFYEAGKTATQLAVDTVADSIQIPFSNYREGRGEGAWYFDESLGRDILDVNILAESKENGGRGKDYVAGDGRRFYRESSRPYRRRHGPDYSTTIPRRRRRYYDEAEEMYYYNKVPSRTIEERYSRPRRPRSEVRSETNEDGSPKSSYGLYRETEDEAAPSVMDEVLPSDSQQEQQPSQNSNQQQKRHWKDRVRHKFDVALGLDTAVSSNSESYYDSWKSRLEQMDDGRKEILRNKLNNMDDFPDVSAAKMPDMQSRDQNTYPNNRRARRRARISSITSESQQRTPIKTPSKSRTEEVPFWREGGSLASLLFDTQNGLENSSGNGTRYKRRIPKKNSLERLILSPRGRDHTVTSLVVYSTRMVLSSFGILCRWAGVRGTIPQPIVVISVFASIVSARRGQRIIALLISLLGLRMVGEFIHGSLYGNEFWDDEYDSVAHAWGKDRKSSDGAE